MTVQARFFVKNIEMGASGGATQGWVTLSVVTRGPENKKWAVATPSGELRMYVSQPAAFEWFKDRLGNELALDFSDRPALCDVCHEEVPVGIYGEPESGVDDYANGKFFHAKCKPTA